MDKRLYIHFKRYNAKAVPKTCEKIIRLNMNSAIQIPWPRLVLHFA